MKRRLVVAALIFAWFVTGAFGTPPPPGPNPSGRSQSSYLTITDDYTEYNACAFPIRAKTVGAGWLHTVYYANGQLKQWTLTQVGTRTTFTNLHNGKELTSPSANMMQTKQAIDGTVTLSTMHGLVRRIVVPGQGVIVMEIGDVIYSVKVDQSGRASASVVQSGAKDFAYEKLCPYLD